MNVSSSTVCYRLHVRADVKRMKMRMKAGLQSVLWLPVWRMRMKMRMKAGLQSVLWLPVWRTWFFIISLDQWRSSALCSRGQRSFWSGSPVGLLCSSGPGSPRTTAPPSDRPNPLLSSPSQVIHRCLTAGRTQQETNHKRLDVLTLFLKNATIIQLQRRQEVHLKSHKEETVSSAFQKLWIISPRRHSAPNPREESPDCRPQKCHRRTNMASLSQTPQSNAPGACLHGEESFHRAATRCPNSLTTWCLSTGSTSVREPSGWSEGTTVGRPGTSSRSAGNRIDE